MQGLLLLRLFSFTAVGTVPHRRYLASCAKKSVRFSGTDFFAFHFVPENRPVRRKSMTLYVFGGQFYCFSAKDSSKVCCHWGLYSDGVCGKVFKWLKKMGGLSVMKERNEEKAKILYDFLDQSKLFKGTVRKEDRSLMNVPFVTGDAELDAKFVKEATAAGFVNLKGHRTVGGMRASIYNAMPKEGVEKLVEFMKKFEEENA